MKEFIPTYNGWEYKDKDEPYETIRYSDRTKNVNTQIVTNKSISQLNT